MKLMTTVAVAVILAGGAAPAAAALPTADRALQGLPVPTTATVTAAQLGPDSTIAVVTTGTFEKIRANELTRSLEVITGDGVRHPVYTVETKENANGWYPGDFAMADWRPELHTALLRVSRGSHGDTLVSYDVSTGSMHEVPAPRQANAVALDPDGSGVLMTTYATDHQPTGRLATLTWDGIRTWLPARAEGAPITSIDGGSVVTAEGQQWWVTDLASRTSAAVDTPGHCVPHRWLDADTVVATCSNRWGMQLRQVDLDGSSWRMGIRHTERTRASGPPVFNDEDVRMVQGRSWYESYGGCGGGFLTRQTAADTVRLVPVPGREGALSLVGTRGNSLVLAHQKDDCESAGSRAALTLFDPVSKVERELTRLARDEQWREVFLATEVRSWFW